MYNEQIAAQRSKCSGKLINLHRNIPPSGNRRSFCRSVAVRSFNEAEFDLDLDISLIFYLSLTPTVLESHQIMKKTNGITNLLHFFQTVFPKVFLGETFLSFSGNWVRKCGLWLVSIANTSNVRPGYGLLPSDDVDNSIIQSVERFECPELSLSTDLTYVCFRNRSTNYLFWLCVRHQPSGTHDDASPGRTWQSRLPWIDVRIWRSDFQLMIPSFVSELSEKILFKVLYSFMLLLPQPLGLGMAFYLLANVEFPQG